MVAGAKFCEGSGVRRRSCVQWGHAGFTSSYYLAQWEVGSWKECLGSVNGMGMQVCAAAKMGYSTSVPAVQAYIPACG